MKKTTGSLPDLAQRMADSFRRLTPVQQKRTRKAIYEKVTGKPFREKRVKFYFIWTVTRLIRS